MEKEKAYNIIITLKDGSKVYVDTGIYDELVRLQDPLIILLKEADDWRNHFRLLLEDLQSTIIDEEPRKAELLEKALLYHLYAMNNWEDLSILLYFLDFLNYEEAIFLDDIERIELVKQNF